MSKSISKTEISFGQSSSHIASKELEHAIVLTVSRIHAIFTEEPLTGVSAKKKPGRKKRRVKTAA